MYMYMIMFLIICYQSGKLVMKMFQKIQELIDDKESLVCVLIDEVSGWVRACVRACARK